MARSHPLHQARGRGTALSLPNRFEKTRIEWEAAEDTWSAQAGDTSEPNAVIEEEKRTIRTTFFDDDTQSIISRNQSPDIGFDVSLNPYRGCEHGCSYCYARPYHEYLGLDSGIDFESKILVKKRAAHLLEKELSSPKWRPSALACSGVTDCYQPVEKKLEITRACLEVMARLKHPVGIITKNHLVTRDLDHLQALASASACSVSLSITSLDPVLAHRLEPRASSPQQRLQAVKSLSEAGIPVSVNVAPIIPGLNEHEIPSILEASADHGAWSAGYTVVRLPYSVKDVFSDWLETHRPGEREKILGRIRELRGGEKLNESAFGKRMSGTGALADDIRRLFRVSRKRCGLDRNTPPLSTEAFIPPRGQQLELGF